MSQYSYSQTMFEDKLLPSGETAESAIIDVNAIRPLGHFASQIKVTGSGSVTIELYLSINGTDFALYDTLWEDQAFTVSKIRNHSFAVCTKFKVKATETSGAQNATVSLWIGVQ